jgi:DNA (cytosine-5)-methyltransferase 1
MNTPSPQEIKEARKAAGHTQTQAAAVVGKAKMTWWHWEKGRAPMDEAWWELYLLKTGQKRLERVKPQS